jgi:endoglycosylceramidase
MKKIRYNLLPTILILSFFIGISGCKKEKEADDVLMEDSTVILDQYGRQLILHGLNTGEKFGTYLPWILESDVEREHTEFGFNAVRLYTSWVAIEPEQGKYDENYLDEFAKRVKWYTSRGMYVMIDMHQDIYGAAVGGNGAPDWACITDGKEQITLPGGTPWWLKNIDPAAIAAMRNFWEYSRYKFLQDSYIQLWQKVAERFKNDPYVIGYDLMNEPWGGDIVKVFFTGEFESQELPAFYHRLIPALRTVEPDKYLFVEPLPAPVTFGEPSRLPKIEDTRGAPKIGFAPHQYAYDTHEGAGYTPKAVQQTKSWETERRKDVKRLGNVPLICGEFGLSPDQEGFDAYLRDIFNIFDRNEWHWTYWSNGWGGWSPLNADRSETIILQHLVRTYPKATAGRISSFSYDPVTKHFELSFVSNPSISEPTEIFVPRRHYPEGYDFTVEGTSNYTSSYNEANQVLSLKVSDPSNVTIRISPK